MRTFRILMGMTILAAVLGLALTLPNDPRNLDLPFEASGGGEDEELPPEIIVFYGQQYEGDGIFFCADRSGSMQGKKFARLQRELIRNIREFSENAQFGIVFFDSSTQKFPETGMAKGDQATKSAAISWVMSSQTGKSSCYKEALLAALQMASGSTAKRRMVILLGDGLLSCPSGSGPSAAEAALIAVRNANQAALRVNSICIGLPGRVSEGWMQRLASENSGSYARIVE